MRHRKIESGPADSGMTPSGVETLRVDINQMPRVLLRITRLALRHRGKMALAIACSVGSAAASLALPRLFGTAVDEAQVLLRGGNSPQATIHAALWTTAFLAITATFIRGILTMYAGYLGEYVSQQVAYDLRLRFFRQMQNLSFGFHDQVHSGDLITRGMLDLEGTRVFIQNGVLQTVSLLLLLGFAGVMMVSTDPPMAVIGLLFVPIAGLALARMGFLLRVAWLRIQELMANLTLTMEENLQGVRVVRAFAAKNFEMSKFDKASIDTLNQAYKRIILRGRGLSAMTLSFYASMGALLWYGGHQVAVGAMTAGRVMEFLTYMSLMQTPIRQVAMIFNSAARATSAGSRLFEILDLQPEIADRPQAAQLVAGAGILRFDKVGFAYGDAAMALSDVCFEVRPGQTLGIVGPAGSGKSTIASLVPRFYDVTEGSITIDGQDVRNITLASLRQYVSLVPQEAFLFDNSIGHNVAYSDPWMPDERIVESAVTAQIHDHISTLPQTYETRVGERGLALSGGQRQRLTIARGVAPEPGVIIFDDSAAAIDSVTERRVRDALAGATRTKATIIIAHRLSSLMHADEIVVLEAGRIVERGTHEQLVSFGKTYAETFRMQSKAAALDPHQLTPGVDTV
jgi:ATP-binding cassette subfamily B protein